MNTTLLGRLLLVLFVWLPVLGMASGLGLLLSQVILYVDAPSAYLAQQPISNETLELYFKITIASILVLALSVSALYHIDLRRFGIDNTNCEM